MIGALRDVTDVRLRFRIRDGQGRCRPRVISERLDCKARIICRLDEPILNQCRIKRMLGAPSGGWGSV